MTTTDWIQAISTVVLVLVTIVYVWRTYAISKATKEQAEASVKMAKQMVKPRLMPYFRLTSDFFIDRYVGFVAGINNDGNGPAYDIEFRLEDDSNPPSIFTTGVKISFLREHQSYTWAGPTLKISFPKSDSVQRHFLVVKYKDIDGEYEIRLPFILRTGENDRPFADEDKPIKKLIRHANSEEELP